MPDFYQPMRQLPSGMPPMAGGYERPADGDSMSLGQLFGVLRRRYRLVLIITLLGLGAGAYLAARAPASYKAMAVLRLAGERRALTGEVDPTPELERTTNPILSVAELVRSRSVLGAVVDSLGLRLLSATPEIGTSRLARVYVGPEATNDTIQVTFYQNGVKARLKGKEARARYGDQLDLGPLRFAVTGIPDVSSASLYVIPREMAIDNLYSKISVISRPETDIMDVVYVASNPRTAQRVVNTTVLAFRELNILTAKQKSQRRRQFLEEQLKQTDSMLARAQADLATFRSKQQLASSQSAMEAAQTFRLTLETQAAQLEADRSTFGALLTQLKRGGEANQSEAIRALASSPAMAENATVSNTFRQLEMYQYRLDSMTTGPWRAAPTNPDLIQLKGLITSTKGQLQQAVGSHVSTLDARIRALRNLKAASAAQSQILPTMAAEEARLTGRVQTLTSASDQVRQEFQRARMAEEVEAGDVEIVNLADLPYVPEWTTTPLKLALGLVLGLLVGIGGAFLLEALNTSIRKPEDLEVALHLPGLAVIPRLTGSSGPAPRRLGGLLRPGRKAELDKRPTASSLGTVTQPFSVGVEAFRMLRTSLVWCEQGDEMKTLVVTSAAPGEGKTLTSANLAVTFAHDGLRVLLIDCDVRRPRLHGLFQVPRSPGLMELLTPSYNGDGSQSLTFNPGAGRTDSGRPVTDVIRATNVRGLSLLTCGALPTNPSGLLSGVRMRVLLQELAKSFDLVILDTPPVLATADAGILASLADGVLLVVRAGQTDRTAAKRAHQQLVNVGARVVGTVLNDPGGEVSQYGDYYYPYDYAVEEQ
jgi:polysaccharide biosynthesis transport protein